ncbi:glycosyl hydrolase [Ilyonectria robusta]|uniref:glycosyl hydrolase n=1 Tax=Ilyonectria robusta TaxID=1079257 RepID=UPI001E8EB9C2|nr:glycosyl hydrolase [Ilyonectria robusta]KAH8652969.1 glycosyl hydrolase [Ilyonectria robusta]
MQRFQVNPVIPGFAPDPSVIYVDSTYFLVNSSFHIFPGLPVYASKDLKTWKQIGNALNRPGQLKLQQSYTKIVGEGEDIVCSQGGLYAPTIRYREGTFYIVCTNVIHTPSQPSNKNMTQNFILSTTDIWADEWSEPIFYDFNAIDTSLFWDDDGKVYVIGAAEAYPNSNISQFQIDLKTGKMLSELKVLWEGITRVYTEGPHMYKRDGWYYLLVAEGGCFADHHTIMARSRNIWGPYESNPANPVLGKTDPNGYIQYTGHGDLFQNPSGQWYFLCLGVRKVAGHFIMGRESFLTTATWPVGEFTVIDTVQLDVPLATDLVPCSTNWPQRRKAGRPDISLVHIRDPVQEDYDYEGGRIALIPSKADISVYDEPVTFVGKRHRLLDGSASATLEVTALTAVGGSRLKTGLCYYKDEHRFIRVFVDVDSKEVVLETVNKAKCIERKEARRLENLREGMKITFGVDYTELQFVFWYCLDVGGVQKKERFAHIATLDMTGHDFVGPIIGVFAIGNEKVKVNYLGLEMESF